MDASGRRPALEEEERTLAVTAQQVKDLRQATGAGVIDCKRALEECAGDMERAAALLHLQGMARAETRSHRVTTEGIIGSYIHANNKIGVLVEALCETDFVARNEIFRGFVRDVAMHVAAEDPKYLSREQVPVEVAESERHALREGLRAEGKPEDALDELVGAQMEKFYARTCLMDQPFVRNEEVIIRDLLAQAIAQFGENIVIRRFVRMQLGEEIVE